MRKTLTLFTSAIVLSLFAVTPTYAQRFANSGGDFSSLPNSQGNLASGLAGNFPHYGFQYDRKKHVKTLNSNINIEKFLKGLKAIRTNKFERADIIFSQIDKKVKNSDFTDEAIPTINYHRGIVQYGLGNNNEAVKFLKEAINTAGDNKYYEAHAALGTVYALSNRLNEAEDILNNLKSQAKNCGSTCDDQPRIDKSIKHLELAIATKV